MRDLEDRLRQVRPQWPGPGPEAEARVRTALGLSRTPSPARQWLTRSTHGRRGTRLLVAVALLVTAGAAVAASLINDRGSSSPAGQPASLAFASPQAVGPSSAQIDGPVRVAVDGRGTVTAVWARGGRIVASTRASNGTWSSPLRLSDPAVRSTSPRVGSDRHGVTTVIWRETTAGRRVLESFRLPSGAPAGQLFDVVGRRWAVVSRTRSADGTWSAPERLSPETTSVRDLDEPGLAVASDGGVVVSWDTGDAIWARTRAGGRAWAKQALVGSGSGEAVDPQLSIIPSGRAALIWSNRGGAGTSRRYQVMVATLDPASGWRPAVKVGRPGINPPYPAAGINDTGEAVAAWRTYGQATAQQRLLVATGDAAGHWSDQVSIGGSGSGLIATRPLIVVRPDGAALIVTGSEARAFQRPADGTWGPLDLAPVSGLGFAAVLGVDATAVPVLVRGTTSPNTTVVERLADHRPAPERAVIPGVAAEPSLALGADGTSAIAWVGSDARTVRVVVSSPTSTSGGGGG